MRQAADVPVPLAGARRQAVLDRAAPVRLALLPQVGPEALKRYHPGPHWRQAVQVFV